MGRRRETTGRKEREGVLGREGGEKGSRKVFLWREADEENRELE